MTDSQQDMQKQEACATAPDGDAPKKVNVALRVYGVLMMLMGILDMVVFLFRGPAWPCALLQHDEPRARRNVRLPAGPSHMERPLACK